MMKEILFSKLKSFLLGFISVNIVWYLAFLIANKAVLPNPFLVYKNIIYLSGSEIFIHLTYSFFRVALGMIIAVILGLIVGILATKKGFIGKILNPYIYFTYPVPKIALLPAIMLIFGLRETSKIIMMVLIIIYPVIISVRDAVSDIPKEVYNIFRCFGASKLNMFFNVTLPCAASSILSSVRIALGTALSILFFTEVYGTKYGMGFFIMDAWMRINYLEMYAGIVVLSLTGFLLFMCIDILEDTLLKWKKS